MLVPDFVPLMLRQIWLEQWRVELSQHLPGCDIKLAMCEGPFEDGADGAHTHFEARALGKYNRGRPGQDRDQILALRRDLETAVALLLRQCVLHRPHLIIAEGQGAIVAASYTAPLVINEILQKRNFQREECVEVGQA